MGESIRVMIPEEKVNKRVAELAEEISRDMNGKPVKLICILKGSCFFTVELAKRLTVPVYFDFMSVSSYGNERSSSGRVKIVKDLDESVQGEDVLIVEDIIDSGRTLAYLKDIISRRNAASVKICTLLDKPDRRAVDVDVDYVGFNIPDEFVVGYGMDYAQKYRNLPYVGILDLD